METYGSGEVQKRAKVTKMQLIHWTQLGAILPLKDARGRGGRRIYSFQNIVEAMICRELNSFTIETHIMVRILDYLRAKNFIEPSMPKGGLCTFWGMVKKAPKTKRVFLIIQRRQDYTEKGKSIIDYGLMDSQTIKNGLKFITSFLVINLRSLMDEAQRS